MEEEKRSSLASALINSVLCCLGVNKAKIAEAPQIPNSDALKPHSAASYDALQNGHLKRCGNVVFVQINASLIPSPSGAIKISFPSDWRMKELLQR
jgi:hypothetical protein